jgi:hypothetical protein
MMPNDAKLGLVVGVGLVIAVAVIFFRKEAPAGPTGDPAAAIAKPLAPLSYASGRGRLPLALTTNQPHVAPGTTAAAVTPSQQADEPPP